MSPWTYFNRPTNMAFHDLTTKEHPPKNLRSLLGLSLKFIPTPRYNVPWSYYSDKTLPRMNRDLRIKAYMADKINDDDEDNFNARLYVRSNWEPPEHLFPFPRELPRRIKAFESHLRRTVKPEPGNKNLLPHQRRALNYLRNQTTFLVVQCDKNLGPAVIEREEYIRLVIRDHLSDESTYLRLSAADAKTLAVQIKATLESWISRYKSSLTKDERRFFKHHLATNEDPFATFYATMKVHKSPLKTRPIVSCSGSLLEAIGIWVDDKLQAIARSQRSYFKSSFDLKKELLSLRLPPNCLLFTADAQSMYTNIPTDRALMFIGRYLRSQHFDGVPIEALMEALRLVMKNNVFTFGDTTWKQLTGTAMGTPPAPPWATIYMALNEEQFLPRFESHLPLYRRFIDDIIGIWRVTDPTTNEATWIQFQTALNDPVYKLTWDVSPPSLRVNFMDLTISLTDSGIQTTLYEKPLNLHLYIPSHSCHPPGLLSGMVHGMMFRIHTLCTDNDDRRARTREFFRQLQRRGYQPRQLRPLFVKALRRAQAYTGARADPTAQRNKLRRSLLFHLRYHPKNPPSRAIQSAWRHHVAEPPYTNPLAQVKNYAGTPLGIDRLIIAYNRPLNLGNLLSYRKLKDNAGPPVSSFLD